MIAGRSCIPIESLSKRSIREGDIGVAGCSGAGLGNDLSKLLASRDVKYLIDFSVVVFVLPLI